MKKSKQRTLLISQLKMSGFKTINVNKFWYELELKDIPYVVSIALITTRSYNKHTVILNNKYTFTNILPRLNKKTFEKIMDIISENI